MVEKCGWENDNLQDLRIILSGSTESLVGGGARRYYDALLLKGLENTPGV